jgi:hypothetical protein
MLQIRRCKRSAGFAWNSQQMRPRIDIEDKETVRRALDEPTTSAFRNRDGARSSEPPR